MGFLRDFREFAVRGSVVDLAVGLIIGAAFGKVVTSFVEDVLMPPVSLLLGGGDFSNLFITLDGESHATLAQAREAGAVTINYGLFANVLLQFAIVAFAVFLVVRSVNRTRRKPLPSERPCPHCLASIPRAAGRCRHCTQAVEPVA